MGFLKKIEIFLSWVNQTKSSNHILDSLKINLTICDMKFSIYFNVASY